MWASGLLGVVTAAAVWIKPVEPLMLKRVCMRFLLVGLPHVVGNLKG